MQNLFGPVTRRLGEVNTYGTQTVSLLVQLYHRRQRKRVRNITVSQMLWEKITAQKHLAHGLQRRKL